MVPDLRCQLPYSYCLCDTAGIQNTVVIIMLLSNLEVFHNDTNLNDEEAEVNTAAKN